jgi:hypothetical protein
VPNQRIREYSGELPEALAIRESAAQRRDKRTIARTSRIHATR